QLELFATDGLNSSSVIIKGRSQARFIGHGQLIGSLNAVNNLLNLRLEAGRGGIQFGLGGYHLWILWLVAPGEFLDLAPCLCLGSAKFLDERILQNGRHGRKTLPASIFHGRDLPILTLYFSAFATCIDKAGASARQFIG